jgi:Tol biopolymer transport system component
LLVPSPEGGRERRLARVTAPYQDYQGLKLLAWSPDGKWLAVLDAPARLTSGLSLLSVETGERRKLTVPPATYDDFEPAFSPDGTRLAFVRHASRFAGDVYVLEMTRQMQVRGEPKRLTFDHRPNRSPVWTRDGRALLFTRYDLQGGPAYGRSRFRAGRAWSLSRSRPMRHLLWPSPLEEIGCSTHAR